MQYSSTDPPDSLTDLGRIKPNTEKVSKLRATLKGLDKAFGETHIRIASDWKQSVREVICIGRR